MSIKKDNVNVTAVKYNSQDVNKVILDNKCVWCKPFTYTQGTLPTGVASLTCTRSSTDEPTASTGTIANGGTIYYDDKLYWAATASTGYRITAVKGSNSPVTVSGAITGTTASGLTSARISGTISQGTLPTGVASITCYRKAYNENSFSKYTGSTIYYGDQFYWTATAATGYNNPSLTYNSSSKVYTWNGSQGGSITSVSASGLSAGTRKSFTISFGTTTNKSLYGSWSSSSQTAYYGDKITVSGNSVICYKWDNNSTARWTVKVTASSNTAQYTYSAVTIAESSIASVTAAATFTAYNTRTLNSYTITWKYLSAYPDTWTTATQTYNYGDTPSKTVSNVTSGSARKVPTGWDNLAAVTGNRTITAVYVIQFAPTIKSNNYCTANRSSGTWYDSGTVITWTANDNYSFGGTAVKDTTTQTITSGDTYSVTPGYIKCTISCTRCTSAPATGSIIQVGKSITYTANSNYSYTEHATTASNPPEHTVALGTTSYSRSCDYAYITVSGTNCSANVANGYRKIGNSITWTANTNYAFDSSGKTTVSQTIESSGNYNKDATHGYYTLSLTNCSYSSGNNAGWYALGSKPSTTVQANSSWSFNGSSQDTTTIGGSATVPTTVSASPAYFYLTFTPTNCRCSSNSGYYTSSTKPSSVTWTPNDYYSFDAGSKQTNATTTISSNSPNTYSASPQYVRANSIATGTYNASVDKDANTYYAIGSSVTWTATPNHYYDASGTTTSTNNDTKITAGATIAAPNPTHVKCTISGTNCWADRTTGNIFPVGETITWTGDSGDNFKYSFSNTNPDSTTATAKVELRLTSYKKEAPYLWCNVTSVTGTNCTAYADSNCTTPFTTGWKLSSDKIYWKASAAYAFDKNNSDISIASVSRGENTVKAIYVKRYTLDLSKQANVAVLKAWRTASPYQGATIGSESSPLLNGSGFETIYYGDSLSMLAQASQYYHLSESGSKTVTVTGDVSWAPIAIVNNYPVKIAAGEGISDVYLSSDPNATSGSPSGTEFPFGSTVHAFAQLIHSLVPAITVPSGWVRVDSSGSWIYRVASKQLNPSWNLDFGTINAGLRSYAVTIKGSEGINSVFLSTNHDALSGSPSGTTFKATTTVYAFAAVHPQHVYRVDESKWTKIGTSGSSTVYMVGRVQIGTSPYDFGTITLPAVYMVTASSNNIGLRSTYLSTSSNGTSGQTSLSVASGTTVYGYAVLGSDVTTNKVSSWKLVHGTACKPDAIYKVGSKKITANTTYYINLFDESDYSSVVFKSAGAGAGSWTVNNHEIHSADNYAKIYQSGTSIYAKYSDYNGSEKTLLLGSFTCPAGYTVEFQLKAYNGSMVSWNSWIDLDGPYIVTAVVGYDTTTT